MNALTKRMRMAFTLLELMMVVAVIVAIACLLLPALAKSKCGDRSRINCVNNLKQVGLAFRLWYGDNGERSPMEIAAVNGGPSQQASIADGTGAAYVFQIFQVMSNELGTPKLVVCRADADRNYATNFGGHFTELGNLGISYFVGKNANETNSSQYLAGDRNIGIKPAGGWSGNDPDGGVTGFSPNVSAAGSYRSLTSYAKDPRLQWTEKLHRTEGNVVLADGSVQQLTSAKMRAGITNAGDATWTYFP